jgi:hypothetical protein
MMMRATRPGPSRNLINNSGLPIKISAQAHHLHHQDWSNLAQSLLARRLEETHTNLQQYEAVFDRAVVLNAKSFILLMTVPFALLLPLAFLRDRRPFMTHVVFSLHL